MNEDWTKDSWIITTIVKKMSFVFSRYAYQKGSQQKVYEPFISLHTLHYLVKLEIVARYRFL